MKVTHAYRSFMMFGEVRRRPFMQPRISRIRFERRIGVWRAPMRRQGANREKFFCCKNFDSESVRHPSERTFECFGLVIVQPRQYRE
jgi:hypothetical protein